MDAGEGTAGFEVVHVVPRHVVAMRVFERSAGGADAMERASRRRRSDLVHPMMEVTVKRQRKSHVAERGADLGTLGETPKPGIARLIGVGDGVVCQHHGNSILQRWMRQHPRERV